MGRIHQSTEEILPWRWYEPLALMSNILSLVGPEHLCELRWSPHVQCLFVRSISIVLEVVKMRRHTAMSLSYTEIALDRKWKSFLPAF